jgi:hypothetical protein
MNENGNGKKHAVTFKPQVSFDNALDTKQLMMSRTQTAFFISKQVGYKRQYTLSSGHAKLTDHVSLATDELNATKHVQETSEHIEN